MSSQKLLGFLREKRDTELASFFKGLPPMDEKQIGRASDVLAIFQAFQRQRHPDFSTPINVGMVLLGIKPLSLMGTCGCNDTEASPTRVRELGLDAYFEPLLKARKEIEKAGLKVRIRVEVNGDNVSVCHSGLEVYNPDLVINPLSAMAGIKVSAGEIDEVLDRVSYKHPESYRLLGYPVKCPDGLQTVTIKAEHFSAARMRDTSRTYFTAPLEYDYIPDLKARVVTAAMLLDMRSEDSNMIARAVASDQLGHLLEYRIRREKRGKWKEELV